MSRTGIYLSLSIAGLLIPYAFLGLWLAAGGFDAMAFIRDMLRHPVGAFFASNIILSAISLLAFITIDRRRRDVPGSGTAVIGTIIAGPSFGLPYYLFLRERAR
ncbi:MAG: DUF2834 domain-containing protein [Pseudomonadota bacterium]|nr:DUF2834 domain-containing protein [Pseudomonadota bacterium]